MSMAEVEQSNEIPLIAVLTLVLWTITSGVAVVGVVVPYVRPHFTPKKEMVLTA
jgi:nitrate reductase NapE component